MNEQDARDRQLERLLKDQLTPPAVEHDECLDAEAIAAWLDGGLAGDTRRRAEAHVASCARCQTIVGAVVRTGPVNAAPQTEKASRRWFGWMVPAAALAAAVVLYVAVQRDPESSPDQQRASQSSPDQLSARAEPQFSPSLGGVVAPPSANEVQAPAAAQAERTEQRQREARDQSSRLPKDAPSTPLSESVQNDERRRVRGASADAAPLSAPATPAEKAAAPLTDDVRRQEADATQRPASAPAAASAPVTPPSPAPPPPVQAAPAGGQPNGVAAGRIAPPRTSAYLSDAAAAAPVVVASSGATRWRLNADFSIEYSADRGASWQRVFQGDRALTAGASPSAQVCWVVGAAGLVLRTTDGRTFAATTTPTSASLRSVVATSERQATVTSIDGAAFVTTDGGASWAPAP